MARGSWFGTECRFLLSVTYISLPVYQVYWHKGDIQSVSFLGEGDILRIIDDTCVATWGTGEKNRGGLRGVGMVIHDICVSENPQCFGPNVAGLPRLLLRIVLLRPHDRLCGGQTQITRLSIRPKKMPK